MADSWGPVPTRDEKDALGGTVGSPDAGNKFVTETDSRVSLSGYLMHFSGDMGPGSFANYHGYWTEPTAALDTAPQNRAYIPVSGVIVLLVHNSGGDGTSAVDILINGVPVGPPIPVFGVGIAPVGFPVVTGDYVQIVHSAGTIYGPGLWDLYISIAS